MAVQFVILQIADGPELEELGLMIFLFIVALIALYCALHIPRLPEYQRDDESQTEQR
jgi:hypothetical protein